MSPPWCSLRFLPLATWVTMALDKLVKMGSFFSYSSPLGLSAQPGLGALAEVTKLLRSRETRGTEC